MVDPEIDKTDSRALFLVENYDLLLLLVQEWRPQGGLILLDGSKLVCNLAVSRLGLIMYLTGRS